jgi:hypothetical protein
MRAPIRVLGIDLASVRWRDNGIAIVSFTTGAHAEWYAVEYGCVRWPDVDLSPATMADAVEKIVLEHKISAVSLDGPQGWREPIAPDRPGVGRVCEYEARCQGKTGEYGKTYPQTQHDWIKFCIDLFAELMNRGHARIVNSVEGFESDAMTARKPGQYWLLECFPTSTWRESRLPPLPGKSSVGDDASLIADYWARLQQRFGLPQLAAWTGSHDDLQAIVAALPAAGLLKGPCHAHSKGKAGWWVEESAGYPKHWVEGLLWEATPLASQPALERQLEMPANLSAKPSRRRDQDGANPLLVDERDEEGHGFLERGVRLFRFLAGCANNGEAIGIGYAQLVCFVHGVAQFQQVMNRVYSRSDTAHVLRLANQITEAAGGSIAVSRNEVKIDVGMDAFVWRQQPPHARPAAAFEDAGYSQADWTVVFPDGARRLLSNDEVRQLGQAPGPAGS